MTIDKFEEVTDVLPPEVAPLVQALLEGRVKQVAIIAELENGVFMDCYPILDPRSNRLAMIGAIDVLKRDYMREEIQSRVDYEPRNEDD